MKQNTVETRKGLAVSEGTAKFIDAFLSFEEFREKLYTAICDLYGEKCGDELYNAEEWQKPLEDVERIIFEGVGLSIRDNIDVIRQPNTI